MTEDEHQDRQPANKGEAERPAMSKTRGVALVMLSLLLVPESLPDCRSGVEGAAGAFCRSNAPMSESSPVEGGGAESELTGRGKPRWSVVKPKLLPVSRAGLRFFSAWVLVNPPLSNRTSSSGLIGAPAVPT